MGKFCCYRLQNKCKEQKVMGTGFVERVNMSAFVRTFSHLRLMSPFSAWQMVWVRRMSHPRNCITKNRFLIYGITSPDSCGVSHVTKHLFNPVLGKWSRAHGMRSRARQGDSSHFGKVPLPFGTASFVNHCFSKETVDHERLYRSPHGGWIRPPSPPPPPWWTGERWHV